MRTFDEPVCRTCNSTNIETRLPNLDYCRKCGSSKIGYVKTPKKCSNCIFCDEVKERLIHCGEFEQFMPIEIGKCEMWEQK